MTIAEVREKYLKFFEARGHKIVPSASLVPENDPTTLFTGSGMQPMIPYLLGQKHPLGKRITDSQKCFRAEDIEEVGDNRHTTFFEMLGNWSLGDYWKKEQLFWILEFLTAEIDIPRDKLWVTCFAGDEEFNLPPDYESAEIWKELGIPENRIFFYGSKKNWWSRSGSPAAMPAGEPGGPDSEIFYEFTQVEHDKKFGEKCHPNCNCGRFMEIGNSVFMEHKKTAAGFEKLAQRNVDFGGGLERITAAANDEPDIFKLEVFKGASRNLEGSDPRKSRIILDHIRAATFLVTDGVVPSNKGRGYVLRRLIRRAMAFARLMGQDERWTGFGWLESVFDEFIKEYANTYPELIERKDNSEKVLRQEFDKFNRTLTAGMKTLFNIFSSSNSINGDQGFDLFQSYGFPKELTIELAKQSLPDFDERSFLNEFEERLNAHQELSRTASAGMFKGGLADVSEKTVRLHTAHHLLLKALQIVLGPGVKQRGSNITSERLRMDFLYDGKMTEEQKKEAERIVNEKIAENLPVIRSEMAREEAEKLGAEREFGEKYPERVSVYSVGPKDATPENPRFAEAFSIEFCAGPHVARTGEIGKFRILKEEAVSAGVRRIRGVVE